MKKFLTIILACVLMLCPMSFASAAGDVTYTSDFSGTISTSVNADSGITSYSYSDDVWNISTSSAQAMSYYSCQVTDERLTLSIADNVLTATAISPKDSALTTKNITFTDEIDTVYTVFKFCVASSGYTGQWMIGAGAVSTSNTDYGLLGIGGDGKIYEIIAPNPHLGSARTEVASYSFNTWYTTVVKVTPGAYSATIYKADGTVLATKEIINAADKQFAVARTDLMFRSHVGTNIPLQLKDAKMIATGSAATPALTTTDVAEGDDGVSRKLDVTFNSNVLLDAASVTASLTKGGVDAGNYKVTCPDPFTVRVEGKNAGGDVVLLDRDTEYTLQVGSFTPITFTTEEMHMVTDADLTIDALAADDTVADDDIATLAAGKVKVHLSVTDPLSYPSFSGRMMAVLYTESGHLAWLDYADLSGADFADLNAIFTLPEIPANAQLKVYLFDNENIYAPVCAPVTFGS